MAPSRTRKRDLTSQSLGFLNKVNNTNHNLRPPVLQPSRRKPYAEVQVPKSDNIWDVPRSPEKPYNTRSRRVATSEPITPRRSARFRDQPGQLNQDNDASSGKRLRSPTKVNYKDNEGNEKGNAEQDEEGNDNSDERGVRLFSEDETPKRERPSQPASWDQLDEEEFPDLPSPSALFRGDGFIVSPSASIKEQKPDAKESQGEENGSDEGETSAKESSERGDESRSNETKRPSPRPSSPIVQINGTQEVPKAFSRQRGLRSLAATQETRKSHTQSQPDNDGDQGEESLVNSAVEEESVSSFEPEDGESSSSSSSVQESARSSPDIDDFPEPQRSKRRRVEHDSRSRPSRNRKVTPSLGRQGAGCTRDQSLHPNIEQEKSEDDEEEEEEEAAKEAEKAKEEENARKLQWMEEAMDLGQQRNNWLMVTSKAKELKRLADPSLAKYFVDVCTAIRELRDIYADMVDNPPSHTDLIQCENLLASIPYEGDKLLDQAYHMATQDGQFSDGEEHARDLVDEFEARVIPDMVKLVFACFKVYYTNPMTFPGLHGHFRRVLILLRRFSDRTTSMKMQRIVRAVVRTQGLGRALYELIKGLESRALRRRTSPRIARANNQREVTGFENGTEREWSQDEGLALIDGLRAYQGPDRYLQIAGHFGHRLRHRTQQELRGKAMQVHDKMQPMIATQLKTEDGRRRWEWLLSVRD